MYTWLESEKSWTAANPTPWGQWYWLRQSKTKGGQVQSRARWWCCHNTPCKPHGLRLSPGRAVLDALQPYQLLNFSNRSWWKTKANSYVFLQVIADHLYLARSHKTALWNTVTTRRRAAKPSVCEAVVLPLPGGFVQGTGRWNAGMEEGPWAHSCPPLCAPPGHLLWALSQASHFLSPMESSWANDKATFDKTNLNKKSQHTHWCAHLYGVYELVPDTCQKSQCESDLHEIAS